jgi:hypothetical protein
MWRDPRNQRRAAAHRFGHVFGSAMVRNALRAKVRGPREPRPLQATRQAWRASRQFRARTALIALIVRRSVMPWSDRFPALQSPMVPTSAGLQRFYQNEGALCCVLAATGDAASLTNGLSSHPATLIGTHRLSERTSVDRKHSVLINASARLERFTGGSPLNAGTRVRLSASTTDSPATSRRPSD